MAHLPASEKSEVYYPGKSPYARHYRKQTKRLPKRLRTSKAKIICFTITACLALVLYAALLGEQSLRYDYADTLIIGVKIDLAGIAVDTKDMVEVINSRQAEHVQDQGNIRRPI